MIQEVDFKKLNEVKRLMSTRLKKLRLKETRAEGMAEVLARMYPKNTVISGKVLKEIIEASCNVVGKGTVQDVRDHLRDISKDIHMIRSGQWRVHEREIERVQTLELPKEKGSLLPF